jgi:hypothetical protein
MTAGCDATREHYAQLFEGIDNIWMKGVIKGKGCSIQ